MWNERQRLIRFRNNQDPRECRNVKKKINSKKDSDKKNISETVIGKKY